MRSWRWDGRVAPGGSAGGEGVHDAQATDALAVLQVLAEEPLAAACERGCDDQRVVPTEAIARAELQGVLEEFGARSQTPQGREDVVEEAASGGGRGVELAREDVRRSFSSSRVNRRPPVLRLAWRSAIVSLAVRAWFSRSAYASSQRRNSSLSVVRSRRARFRAASMRRSSALKVTFRMWSTSRLDGSSVHERCVVGVHMDGARFGKGCGRRAAAPRRSRG